MDHRPGGPIRVPQVGLIFFIFAAFAQVAFKSSKLDHMVSVKSSGWVGSTAGAVFFSIKKILYILLD